MTRQESKHYRDSIHEANRLGDTYSEELLKKKLEESIEKSFKFHYSIKLPQEATDLLDQYNEKVSWNQTQFQIYPKP